MVRGTEMSRSAHSAISFSVRGVLVSTRRAVMVLGRIARAKASAFSDGSLSWLISTTA